MSENVFQKFGDILENNTDALTSVIVGSVIIGYGAFVFGGTPALFCSMAAILASTILFMLNATPIPTQNPSEKAQPIQPRR